MGGMCFQLLIVNTKHQEQRTNTRHPPGTVIGGSLSPLKGPSDGSVWWLVGSGHLLTVRSCQCKGMEVDGADLKAAEVQVNEDLLSKLIVALSSGSD